MPNKYMDNLYIIRSDYDLQSLQDWCLYTFGTEMSHLRVIAKYGRETFCTLAIINPQLVSDMNEKGYIGGKRFSHKQRIVIEKYQVNPAKLPESKTLILPCGGYDISRFAFEQMVRDEINHLVNAGAVKPDSYYVMIKYDGRCQVCFDADTTPEVMLLTQTFLRNKRFCGKYLMCFVQ